jgi:hypothetical protein
MAWLGIVDAFCVGMAFGAWLVFRDVKRIAHDETLKALRRLKP